MSQFEIVDGFKLRRKVRAIIVNEKQEFLLIQPHGYKSDAWTLVGGGVEDNETYEDAILREVYEETGINSLISLSLSNVVHWFCFSEKIKARRNFDYDGQIAKVFYIEVHEPVVQIQREEILGFCWANEDEVADFITVPEQYELFREVINEFRVKVKQSLKNQFWRQH